MLCVRMNFGTQNFNLLLKFNRGIKLLVCVREIITPSKSTLTQKQLPATLLMAVPSCSIHDITSLTLVITVIVLI